MSALLVWAALAWSAPVQADEVSGTWTGAVEAHANYFWERSTSVLMPDVSLELDSPSGVEVGAEYLLDVISSASIAQTSTDNNEVFTERRHQGSVNVGYEFDVGAPLELAAGFVYSSEDDYTSRIYLLRAALSPWDRNTTFTMGVNLTDDTILSNADKRFEGRRQAFTMNAGIDQVINPELVLAVGYSLSVLDGFMANPYRRVLVGPLPAREVHPPKRIRHAAYAMAAWYIPPSKTAVHLTQRLYLDSWDIGALNPEVRIIQELHEHLLLSAHYRFYTQSSAFFFRASYPVGHAGHVTNDPKMLKHTTQTVGGRVDLRLGFFEATVPFLAQGWAILTLDRYWSTSAFGDGHIATVGLRVPF